MIADRRLLLVWGKTEGRNPNATDGHPLLYHLIDVAASAEALWDILPAAMRDRIARGALGVEEADAQRAVSLLAGLHDIGKASGFQAKVAALWQRLRDADLDIPLVNDSTPHAAITAATTVLPQLLMTTNACGIAASQEQRRLVSGLAKAVGAHHGSFPSTNIDDPAVLGGAPWAALREGLARRLASALYPGAPAIMLTAEDVVDPVAGALFTGLVAVSDWIGSSADHFALSHEADIEAYAVRARSTAKRALHDMGWLPAPRFAGPIPFQKIVWGTTADGGPVRFHPRGIQRLVQEVVDASSRPYMLMCEAAMGEGKTEAALYCVDRATATGQARGAAVCMPTQATGNAMFDRVLSYLEHRGHSSRINLQLVHGNAGYNDHYARIRQLANGGPSPSGSASADDEAPVVAESWFTSNRQALLAPFGVGTIDQSLMAVLQTKHWFVRLFGLAGKVVVFDEVHAYDAYMNELLQRLIRWLSAMDCSVILLSATLPDATRRALAAAYAPDVDPGGAPYPRVTVVSRSGNAVCRTVTVEARTPRATRLTLAPCDPEHLATSIARDLPGGGCAVVVCNTVRNAQDAYAACVNTLRPRGWEVELFHARTLARWRKERESAVLDKLGKPGRAAARPARYVLIGTQVLEQSLDYDADWMASEFAPVDLLLQRMGRMWRHERSDRPTSRPVFTVMVDTKDDADGALGVPTFPPGSGAVYAPYLLLRSYLALHDRDHVTLPTDIEPLVTAVYDGTGAVDELPGAWHDALTTAYAALMTNRHEMQGVAHINLIPDWRKQNGAPKDFASIYQSTAHLDDGDDPRVHRSLRAQTRLGDPTITMVCLEPRADGKLAPVGADGRAAWSPSDPGTIRPDVVREMLQSAVSVARPKSLFRALLDEPVPDSWTSDRHLRYARLAVFKDSVARVGSFALRLTPECGLSIERESSE